MSVTPRGPGKPRSGRGGRVPWPFSRHQVPEGIRPTKVGMWFVALTLLIGVAATNTGNNALYMVAALQFGALIVSGVMSRNNVRRVEVAVTPPEELFAGSPAPFRVELTNRSALVPRWLLELRFSDHAPALLCPRLGRGATATATVELEFPSRGLHRIDSSHLGSLFPLGLFRKGMRQRLECEVLVYPRLRPGRHLLRQTTSAIGDAQDHRAGWGHDLHSLRELRPGDDPRRIHWKQTARTGNLIFMEREAERSRRVTVVLDNALDAANPQAALERLELRIGEAAAAVVAYLRAGFELSLVTRSDQVPFGAGPRQRRRVLETLALLEPATAGSEPLASEPGVELRFEAESLGAA